MQTKRTIVVTGAASGLGAAVADRLKRDDHRVIGIDRHQADIVADLGTPEGRAQAVREATDRASGVLDGVVSCAGLGPYDEPTAITRVNYFGALAILDGLRDCLARGNQPAAVAISSVGAVVEAIVIPEHMQALQAGDEAAAVASIDGQHGNTAYVNAKRALALEVRRGASEWGALGIRLNAIAPGKTETPMLDRLLSDDEHAPAIEALPVPLQRSAPAAEVAGAVVFLLGPDSRYVHGQVLFVDGGSEALMRPDSF
jgi:NAD(P)-dependent dehydrogenase (short-subunit alcohol dehydrogenase family)